MEVSSSDREGSGPQSSSFGDKTESKWLLSTRKKYASTHPRLGMQLPWQTRRLPGPLKMPGIV